MFIPKMTLAEMEFCVLAFRLYHFSGSMFLGRDIMAMQGKEGNIPGA